MKAKLLLAARALVLVLLASWSVRWAAPLHSAQASPVSLSGPMLNGDVQRFTVAPDGQTVIFTTDERMTNFPEFYRVSLSGGEPVRLSAPLTETKRLRDFALTANNRWIVYGVEHPQNTSDPYQMREVFRHPIDDSESSLRLSHALTGPAYIYRFSISRDGRYAVYRVCDHACEIYSVPVDGSRPPWKVNYALPPSGTIWEYSITADSQWVLYIGEQDVDDQVELYAVPISGTASDVRKLNVQLEAQSDVMPHYFSFFRADTGRAFYFARQSGTPAANLFSVPVAGDGPNVPLLLLPPGQSSLGCCFVTATAVGQVLYASELLGPSEQVIYSVPASGPATARVQRSTAIHPGYDLHSIYGLSPDAGHFVFVACTNCSSSGPDYKIYSAPLSGLNPVSHLLAEDLSAMTGLTISPNSQNVLYGDGFGTHQVPIVGPPNAAMQLSPVTGQLDWSPGNCHLVVRTADQMLHIWPYGEVYTDTVQVIGPISLDYPPFQRSWSHNAIGTWLVYLADNGSGHYELYAVERPSCYTEKVYLPHTLR